MRTVIEAKPKESIKSVLLSLMQARARQDSQRLPWCSFPGSAATSLGYAPAPTVAGVVSIAGRVPPAVEVRQVPRRDECGIMTAVAGVRVRVEAVGEEEDDEKGGKEGGDGVSAVIWASNTSQLDARLWKSLSLVLSLCRFSCGTAVFPLTDGNPAARNRSLTLAAQQEGMGPCRQGCTEHHRTDTASLSSYCRAIQRRIAVSLWGGGFWWGGELQAASNNEGDRPVTHAGGSGVVRSTV